MKRLISFIICMLMLLSLVPAAVYAEETETVYELPEAGDTVDILSGFTSTGKIGKAEEAEIGGEGSKYYIHNYGEGYAHTVKFRKFSEDNTKSYDPDIILYCIQFAVADTDSYEAFEPAKHEYWQGLTEIAREGILLSLGLGYPASTPKELSSDSVTVTADDALAATQTLAWEFELGLRTDYEPYTAEEIAAKNKKLALFTGNYAGNPDIHGINGTPAETAYNKILELIRDFKAKTNVTLEKLEDDPNFILLAKDGYQTILSYRLPGEPLPPDGYEERGAIEIHKTDTDGYPLAGAKFEIRDASGQIVNLDGVQAILTTDENGYAFTGADALDYGTYYVREIEAPEGYERVTTPWTVTLGADTPMIDGVRKVVIEAVNESVKISLTVNKVWNDADDQDGKRPDSITVKLLADGVEIDSAQLAADGWAHTFDALPKYRDGGVEISYSVLEVVPEGYTASYDVGEGIVTITNTYTPATTSLTVNKVWNDADDQDGKRPDSITVKLLADGVEIDSAQLAADGWAHTFDALPKYRDGGIEISYSVLEVVPDGYTAAYDVAEGIVTITNTYTPATTSLTVNKVWNDADDQDGKRPDSITVKLLADGVEIESAELTADGWAHVFDALPKYRDGGIEISYSVIETVPDGYTAAYDVAEGVVTITNTYTPATTSLTVNKVWNDADDQDGKRPDSITVKLLADGVEVDSAQLAADGWAHTFDALPKYRDGGIEIAYSVLEVVPDGYTASYDVGEGIVTITNTYTPEATSLTVNKVWNDANDQDGKRPAGVTVKLLADGVEIDSAQLAADGWTHTFDALLKYRDGGIEISYSVLEVVPDGYTAAYDVAKGIVTITNTYTPELTSVNVTKTWYDENDNDNIRPASVTIRLYADGVEIAVCELSAASDWAHLFSELPRYRDGGQEIVYTITEDPVTDYETVYDGYDVFNSHDPYRCDITVNKVWDDEDNVHGLRPDSVTVRLFADGVEIDSAVLSAENGWSVTFDGLLEFAYGSAIVYEIREDDVASYSSRIEGSAEDGFTVVNTVEYVPPTGDGASLAAPLVLAVLSLAAPLALKRRRRSDA